MHEARELELKLEVDPADIDRLRAHPLLQTGLPPECICKQQRSVYFDTPDGKLRASGMTLRLRTSDGGCVQTLKIEGDRGAAGLFDRAEWEQEVASNDLDLAALAKTPLAGLLSERASAAELAPVFEAHVARTSWRLVREGGTFELSLDVGEVRAGGRTAPINEVELELKEGPGDALFSLAGSLSEQAPLRIGVLTKAERGHLLLSGRYGSAVKAEPVGVTAQMSAAQGFQAVAHACIRHFRMNEVVLTTQRDASALHQARVAVRRLRSAFSLFREVVADDRGERLRSDLRWIAGELGRARNLDVMLGGELDDALRPRLQEERERAYDEVIATLNSFRFRSLMLDLVAWIETGPWLTSSEAGQHAAREQPLSDFAALTLQRQWRKLKKKGKRLDALDLEELHRLRIDAKKLRYGSDFVASLFSRKKVSRRRSAFAEALTDLQESLGQLNDIVTARSMGAANIASEAPAVQPQGGANPLLDDEEDEFEPTAADGGGGRSASSCETGSADRDEDATGMSDDMRMKRLIADAARAYAALRHTGPYWR